MFRIGIKFPQWGSSGANLKRQIPNEIKAQKLKNQISNKFKILITNDPNPENPGVSRFGFGSFNIVSPETPVGGFYLCFGI